MNPCGRVHLSGPLAFSPKLPDEFSPAVENLDQVFLAIKRLNVALGIDGKINEARKNCLGPAQGELFIQLNFAGFVGRGLEKLRSICDIKD